MSERDQYRRLIRASELARWDFCHRAWWLQYVRGHEPANPIQLQRGKKFHAGHGRKVHEADVYHQLALWIAVAGLGLLFIAAAIFWIFM